MISAGVVIHWSTYELFINIFSYGYIIATDLDSISHICSYWTLIKSDLTSLDLCGVVIHSTTYELCINIFSFGYIIATDLDSLSHLMYILNINKKWLNESWPVAIKYPKSDNDRKKFVSSFVNTNPKTLNIAVIRQLYPNDCI